MEYDMKLGSFPPGKRQEYLELKKRVDEQKAKERAEQQIEVTVN